MVLSATSLAWAQYNPYAPPPPSYPQQYTPPPSTYNPYAPPPPSYPQQYAPAPYVPSPPVAVNFRARAEDRYRIAVDNESCTTPCTLKLRPGAFVMNVESDREKARMDLEVMRATNVDLWTSSRAGYIVGGALLAVGVVGIGLGGWFIASAPWEGHEAVGAVNVVLGATALAVGIAELALAGKIRVRAGGE